MINKMYENLIDGLRRCLAKLSSAWLGASIAILVVTFILWADFSYGYFLSQPHWLTALAAIVVGFAIAGAIAGAALIMLGVLSTIPRFFLWSLAVAVYLIWIGFDGLSTDDAMSLAWQILVPTALIGAGVGFIACNGWRTSGYFLRIISLAAIGVGSFILGAMVVALAGDGDAVVFPHDASSTAVIAHSSLPNPAFAGNYVVHRLTYGSGLDKRRPEYGSTVDIITTSVDGSPFVDNWDGWAGWWRSYYWGFGPTALPRNAIVWHPDGDGPFPLVLIVHGNTLMELNSERGYEYLANLLASRGYVVVSIDENFLNSSWHSLWQGVSGTHARAWLLLEHLKLWREWSNDSTSHFYRKVDLDNIALIGHSRGGEAICLAKTFNRLPCYPDDCTIAFDYGFAIKSLIGIAPVDRQYDPEGIPNRLSNVNYLVLHGNYDGDVRAFQGSAQYQRISFDQDTPWFKSSVYIYGANHGQFNTEWGRYDVWPLEAWFLNVKPLMKPDDQRQIAQVYVSAFLDITLKGNHGYRSLLQDHRVGKNWLPSTVYITNYQVGTYRYIADFDEDVDPTSTTIKGGKQLGHYLSTWREHRVCLKYGCMDTDAVFLGWDAAVGGGTPRFAVEIPQGSIPITKDSSLVFSMADARTEMDVEQVIDLTVEVVDAAGQSAKLPLSHYSGLQPSLPACVWKKAFFYCGMASDNVYQSFAFPMRDFLTVNPNFNPENFTTVRLLFDRTPSWDIILDDIGFRPY